MPRQMRCICLATRPSDPAAAFFQDQGPGSKYAEITCRHCQCHQTAHTPEAMARNRSLTCTTFEAKAEGHEFDSFYCGCRGWD